jgi:hypothetical protein
MYGGTSLDTQLETPLTPATFISVAAGIAHWPAPFRFAMRTGPAPQTCPQRERRTFQIGTQLRNLY